MADLLHFEDFSPGDVIELGSYPPLRTEEIVAFACQWDPQPFHVDPVRAAESIWGGIIASGWHTGVILMRLLVDGLLSRCDTQGSPGVDHMRFLIPVRPGDALSGRYTVMETEPSTSRPELGKIKARSELSNQRDETVLTLVSTGFYGRREITTT